MVGCMPAAKYKPENKIKYVNIGITENRDERKFTFAL